MARQVPRLSEVVDIQNVFLVRSGCQSSVDPLNRGDMPGIVLDISAHADVRKSDGILEGSVQFDLVGSRDAGEVFRISATYKLYYCLVEPIHPTADDLKAFAELNAVYNAWPYWREFCHGTAMRMDLPLSPMPTYRFARGTTNPAADSEGKG